MSLPGLFARQQPRALRGCKAVRRRRGAALSGKRDAGFSNRKHIGDEIYFRACASAAIVVRKNRLASWRSPCAGGGLHGIDEGGNRISGRSLCPTAGRRVVL
jgi:hypothetical protein